MTPEKFSTLTPAERLTAVGIECAAHPAFSLLTGLLIWGERRITDTIPTAATDGRNEYYNPSFIMAQSQQQLRYVRLHEAQHKALMHCTPRYAALTAAHGPLVNAAMDYVINLILEDTDPDGQFISRPTSHAPLVDPRFRGMDTLQVLDILLHEQQQQNKSDSGIGNEPGAGSPSPQGFDEHLPGTEDADEQASQEQYVRDALREGRIMADNIARKAGLAPGGHALAAAALKSTTDWRKVVRDFVTSRSQGRTYKRWSVPNARLGAAAAAMAAASGGLRTTFPSYFDLTIGPLVLAVDTSGSLVYDLPVVLGEIAAILQQARPRSVTVLWWDTAVSHPQTFHPGQYDNIARLLAPEGGGGTDPQCVIDWLRETRTKPEALIWITDGEFYRQPTGLPHCPTLWGVLRNPSFTPPNGRKVNISTTGV